MGAEDILRIPLNGVYISRMIKIALETANALISRVTITVGLGGATRPKLTKIATSHETRTTSMGVGRELLSDSMKTNQLSLSQIIEERDRLDFDRRLMVIRRREEPQLLARFYRGSPSVGAGPA